MIENCYKICNIAAEQHVWHYVSSSGAAAHCMSPNFKHVAAILEVLQQFSTIEIAITDR